MMTTKTCVLLVAFAACGDNLRPAVPERETRTIKGFAKLIAHDLAGTPTAFPLDLHDTLIRALVPDGDAWDVVEGPSTRDGTFEIDDVPPGYVWIEVDDVNTGARQLLWTNDSDLAFEEHAVGRGTASLARPGTTLTLGPIDGLAPVQPGDSFQLASGDLGISANLFPGLADGATTFQETRSWAGQPLISAMAGDDVTITQLRLSTDATTGLDYVSPVKAAHLSVEQQDAGNTRVTGTFETPPALDYHLVWLRSQFAAARAEIHPTRAGAVAGTNVAVRAMPGGPRYGTSVLAPPVISFASDFPTTEDDIDTHFQVANPYPASWLFNDFNVSFPVNVVPPDGVDIGLQVAVAIEVDTNQLASGDNPIAPSITPPLAPQLDGHDLFTDLTGVGTTPTVSWSPPRIGRADAYVISLERWDVLYLNTVPSPMATLIVPGDVTSVRLPARLLESGESYLMQIAAISLPGLDVRRHSLYTLGVPFATAPLITNTFSP